MLTRGPREKSLGSPNRMVWEYYECLKRQAQRSTTCTEREINQEVALTVILAVTVVEIFLNGYFRVVVGEEPFRKFETGLLADLRARISLERKLKEWPTRILGAAPDPDNANVRAFADLKELRNRLVHFTSSHESIELPDGVTIQGLADTTAYSALSGTAALACIDTVRGYVYEIFRLRGIPPEQWPHALHAWFGEVPGTDLVRISVPDQG